MLQNSVCSIITEHVIIFDVYRHYSRNLNDNRQRPKFRIVTAVYRLQEGCGGFGKRKVSAICSTAARRVSNWRPGFKPVVTGNFL